MLKWAPYAPSCIHDIIKSKDECFQSREGSYQFYFVWKRWILSVELDMQKLLSNHLLLLQQEDSLGSVREDLTLKAF